MAPALPLLVLTLFLAACGGGADPNRSLQSGLEAERRARQAAEAELRRREGIAELNAERDRLKREKAEEDARKLNEEAQRQAEEQRRKKAERLAQLEAARKAAEAERKFRESSHTFLPWPNHSIASPTDLGPWTDPNHGLSMVASDYAAFGVRQDGTPWIHGRLPDTSLYANPEVRRTYDEYGYYTSKFSKVRWTGALIGYAPDRRTVTGSVTLGDFDFSGRNYSPGAWSPGEARLAFSELQYQDTQDTWGDGDLLYWVHLGAMWAGTLPNPIHNNSFFHPTRVFRCHNHADGCSRDSIWTGPGGTRHLDSAEGVIRGMLLGPKHEAMAGTLQRDDLTAAFGGRR